MNGLGIPVGKVDLYCAAAGKCGWVCGGVGMDMCGKGGGGRVTGVNWRTCAGGLHENGRLCTSPVCTCVGLELGGQSRHN